METNFNHKKIEIEYKARKKRVDKFYKGVKKGAFPIIAKIGREQKDDNKKI